MVNKTFSLAILGLILSGCGGKGAKAPIPANVSCVHPLKSANIPSDPAGDYMKSWEETSPGSGLYKPKQWALITAPDDAYSGCYVPPGDHDTLSTKSNMNTP
jgi:hypothetical protein